MMAEDMRPRLRDPGTFLSVTGAAGEWSIGSSRFTRLASRNSAGVRPFSRGLEATDASMWRVDERSLKMMYMNVPVMTPTRAAVPR